MRPLRPAPSTTAQYPRHRRLHLRRAGVAITVLLIGCGTTDQSAPNPTQDTGIADATETDTGSLDTGPDVCTADVHVTETTIPDVIERDTTREDTAIEGRVALRAPELGEAYFGGYIGTYHVVVQVPEGQLDAVQSDEERLLEAAAAVLPSECHDFDTHTVDDDTLGAFVDALPEVWSIGVEHAEITYVCDMPMAGDVPEGDW